MDKEIPIQIQHRRRRNLILRWVAICTALVIGGILLINFLQKSVDRHELKFGTVDTGPLQTMVNASGTVCPIYEEIITSPVDSRIVKVYVREGDTVSAGTPLLQLDLSTVQTEYDKMLNNYQVKCQELKQLQIGNHTRLSELEMQIKVKDMEVSRMSVEADNERRLDSIGSGTGERVRQAETALITAQLELEQLRQRLVNERQTTAAAEQAQQLGLTNYRKDMDIAGRTLDQGRIPAPYSGVVSYIDNKIGSRISPGEKVAVVSDLSSFAIIGQVPEGNSQRVMTGAPVEVRLNGQTLQAIVSNVTASAQGGAVSIDVALDDASAPGLRAGMHVDLYIGCGYKDNITRVPLGSFFKGPGEYELFVADGDDRLVKRHVILSDSNREYAEVISGLAPGDRVVISDMTRFSSSKKIRIK